MYETFLRLVIIFLMLFAIVSLGISAYNINGVYSAESLILHKSIAIVFMIILPIHIYLRREKLKKMFLDLYAEIFDKELKSSCRNHKLIKTLKQRSLIEVCQKLNFDIESTLEILKDQKIDVQNIEDDLQKISEQNRSDSLKIVAIILEHNIRTPRAI